MSGETPTFGFFDQALPNAVRFEAWRATAGGAWLMHRYEILARPYAMRWMNQGRRVSPRLLWEVLRDDLVGLRPQVRQRFGVRLSRSGGWALDNRHLSFAARALTAKIPAWVGMFEERSLGRNYEGRTLILGRIKRKSA